MEGTKGQTQEWIQATQTGDLAWFDEFYLENKASFLKWAAGEFSLPEEDLKDVYQQATIAFYENLVDGKLKELTSSKKTYLFGIGKNLLLKRVNKKEIENRHIDRVKEHWLFQGQEIPENSSLIIKVKESLADLKEPCQSILEMFYIENLSLETIGDKLNYSSSDVVKTQKSRCLKNFRTKLSEWWNSQNK